MVRYLLQCWGDTTHCEVKSGLVEPFCCSGSSRLVGGSIALAIAAIEASSVGMSGGNGAPCDR
eukprot:719175-Amphidinium_carterae.1